MKFEIEYPAPELQHLIRYYWRLQAKGNVQDPEEFMVPDGYEEIIFNFAGGYNRRFNLADDNKIEFARHSFIVGCKSEGVFADNPEDLNMVGVKLWPGSLALLTGIPMAELKEQPLSLCDLNNKNLNRLFDRIQPLSLTDDIVTCLNTFFIGCFTSSKMAMVRKTSALLFQHHGNLSINAIAQALGCHDRTLEKKFLQVTGLRPKQLARSLRFKRAFHLLQACEYKALDLHALGFYDQSHFIKEFRHFTGHSPRQFFAQSTRNDVSVICLENEVATQTI